MGSSNWQNISRCIELIRLVNPQKILDFGIGFGRWGILSREFLEIWDNSNYSGKWERQIDGLEVFPDYIKSYHSYFYNNIYIEEGYGWIKNCREKYDLIIFGDVLEHFDKSKAEEIIQISLLKSDFIMINIPLGEYWEQNTVNENKYEEHKSVWNLKDFNKYKFKKIKLFKDFVGRIFSVVLISDKNFDLNTMAKLRYGRHYKIRNKLIYTFKLRRLFEYITRKY